MWCSKSNTMHEKETEKEEEEEVSDAYGKLYCFDAKNKVWYKKVL